VAGNVTVHENLRIGFYFQEQRAMANFTRLAVSFLRNEDGPTAVEYAVMLALIIVVCIAAIATLGSNANLTFSKVGSSIGG
jgi:pilus assembly protein Flp/PilA